jgi:hypothetical protein
VVEEEFDLAAAILMAPEAGGKDPGVVDYQEVARIQPLGQVPEVDVADGAPVPVEHQQAGGISMGQRVLGHQLSGQRIIVVMNAGSHEGHPRN